MGMLLQPKTLKKYTDMIRPILVRVAKNKDVITYKELQEEMGGPGRGYIGKVLEEVSDSEYEENRPLLSALVVHKTNGIPGNGFWKLRVFPPSLKNASAEEKKDRWEKEKTMVWDYWEKHNL
jgi:hypothetical protein